jgi:hypothetical protein
MPGSPGTPPPADPAPGARLALVIATASYADAGLRRLRAPATDAADLAQVLADPAIGGFTVTTVLDQPAQEIRIAVEDFLTGRGTQDLLIVYLSCHGLLDVRRRLYFAATDTRMDRLGATGVESAWLLDQLEHCRARRQVLILDSCFSGAFARSAKGEPDLGLEDRFLGQGRGRVVLTASSATEYSFEGQPTDAATPAGSVFTAALVQGLRTGAADGDGDGHVSVDDAYRYVFDQVQAAGAHQTPQRWLYGGEGTIVLARSPLGSVITPVRLPEAIQAALESPYPGLRIGAVTELGEWLASGDPARALAARRRLRLAADTEVPSVAAAARNLLDAAPAADAAGTPGPALPEGHPPAPPLPPGLARAERIARTLSSEGIRAQALALLSAGVARLDPGRAAWLADEAEQAAAAVTDQAGRLYLLNGMARALAASDPARAARLADSAEQAAYAMTGRSREDHLFYWSEELAASDPDRAERVASAITDQKRKERALAQVAEVVAGSDPDHAERIARVITDDYQQAQALRDVAEAAADSHPDHAEQIAYTLPFKWELMRNHTLREISSQLAEGDPERAERMARSVTGDEAGKALALDRVAAAVAGSGPQRAARLAKLAENTVNAISSASQRAEALARLAAQAAPRDPVRAARLADRAEQAADETTDRQRPATLARMAVELAASDPVRAARLAGLAEDGADTITIGEQRADVLKDAAIAVAGYDPRRAVRLAGQVAAAMPPKDRTGKAVMLSYIAPAVAAYDIDAAERIAHIDPGTDYEPEPDDWPDWHAGERTAKTLAEVAEKAAARDPRRAEQIIGTIADENVKTEALWSLARLLAGKDPDQAERITRAITSGEPETSRALAALAVNVASCGDLDRAERIARTITDESQKSRALAALVTAVASCSDLDRAERIANTITSEAEKEGALLGIITATASQAT